MLRFPADLVERFRSAYEGRMVCVTGGAGFIGGHLVDSLLSVGANITVIDDLSNSSAEHLAELIELEPKRVRFVHGSILDPDALAEAIEGAWRVFHLAAVASVPQSIADPERNYLVNVLGTMRVAQAAVHAGVGRIIYSASSSAYGETRQLPKREDQLPTPVSPYAAAKLAGEHVMQAWSASYGISTVSLRYFNMFGPRQRADSPYAAVIAIFARRLLQGEAPVIYGDGRQTRDFTHISNAVQANLLAGLVENELAGEVVNIGSSERIDLMTLARMMARLCGVPEIEPIHEAERAGDVRDSQADISRAGQLLGYRPLVDLESGLRETVAWYRGLCAQPR